MDVSVITVTYNSASCIRACIASVAAQKDVRAEMVVVDNAGGDGTPALIEQIGGVRLLANKENIGYGRANNQGFAATKGRFIYLLNPDAELVGTDALAKLCRTMEDNPKWGMAGTRIVSVEGAEETRPLLSYPGQRHVRRDFSKLPGQIAWVLGASMIVRREVYAALRGFDPGFFLYCEETDFSLRLRELGHEIGLVSDVTVRHVGGASEAGRDPYDVCQRKMNSIIRFRQKHYSAEDAARLARRDRYRARFRMLWYSLFLPLRPRPSVAWRKHRQYRAIWEISKKLRAARQNQG